jgi:hypothetical protein
MVLPACKRKEIIDTKYTRLLHTWQLSQLATDDNGNGKIDPTEPHALASGYNSTITFKDDSSGSETITINDNSVDYFFYWDLATGDSIYRYGVGHNTIRYHIDDMTSLTLKLTAGSAQGPVTYYYKRK